MGKSIENLSSVTRRRARLAKNVFQVHGVDAKGATIVARPVRRGQLLSFFASCRAAWWAWKRAVRRIIGARALSELGHEVKLIPPAHVKPYVRRNKNDAADAAAICEAVGAAEHALCGGSQRREPGRADAPSGARTSRGQRTGCSMRCADTWPRSASWRRKERNIAYALKRLPTDGADDNGEVVVPDCVREALRAAGSPDRRDRRGDRRRSTRRSRRR